MRSPRVAFASSICACTVFPPPKSEAKKASVSLTPDAASLLTNSSASAWKRSPFATKSVSQLSSRITPESPSTFAVTSPFEVARPSRLVTPLSPLTRMISTALLKSPPASSSAFLQSNIPAAVCSRRRFTSSAVYDMYLRFL